MDHSRKFIGVVLSVLGALELAGAAEPPPIDTSALDSVLEALGGSIPFPPQTLYETLEAKGYRVLGEAVVPAGRNLERRSTDYASPRSEFAVNPGPFDSRGKVVDPSKTVFFAYVPKLAELQIIGSGLSLPADFRRVPGYSAGSTAAKAEKVRDIGLCITCHQNGTAIFPEGPWDETDHNAANRKKMLETEKLDPFARFLINRKFDSVQFPPPNNAAPILNDAVLYASTSTLFAPARREQTCGRLCGEGLECRRALLLAGLLSSGAPASVWNRADRVFTPERQKTIFDSINRNARRDMLLGSLPQLLNRDSFDQEACISPGPGNDPLTPRPGALDVDPSESNKLIGTFELHDRERPYLINQKSALGEPLRSLVEGVVQSGHRCFPFYESDEFRQGMKAIPPDQVLATFYSPRVEALLKNAAWPPSGKTVLAAFQAEASRPLPAADPVKETGPRSGNPEEGTFEPGFHELMKSRGVPRPLSAGDPKVQYQKYCARCHVGGDAPPLPLGKLEDLSNYSGAAGRTVKSMLEAKNRLMPPPGSLMPSDDEREQMIRAVDGGHPSPPPTCRLPADAANSTVAPLLAIPPR